jgi:hypothetical protein
MKREGRPASALIYVERLRRDRLQTRAARDSKALLEAIAAQDEDPKAAARAREILATANWNEPAPAPAGLPPSALPPGPAAGSQPPSPVGSATPVAPAPSVATGK